jgi:hypothetical protein
VNVLNFTVLLTMITFIASLEYVGLRPFSVALVNLPLSVVIVFFFFLSCVCGTTFVLKAWD